MMLALIFLLVVLISATVSLNTDPFYADKGRPTVIPIGDFNPHKDAETLKDAIYGLGTDDDAIMYVLGRRSLQQRLEIAKQYLAMYNADLIEDLRGDLTGDFEDLAVALMFPLSAFYAKELHDAMHGFYRTWFLPDKETLAEILATLNNNAIKSVKPVYEKMYSAKLEVDLECYTDGSFKGLLVSLSMGNRVEDITVDPKAAAADARTLYEAETAHNGPDETVFNSILVSRSYPQLRRIFQEYEKLRGTSFELAVKELFSGDIKIGYLAIVKYAQNKAKFFAERLHDAMDGLGTTDRTLIRIFVARSETDLGDIREEYERMYGTQLRADIFDETSDEYKQLLLLLLEGKTFWPL